MIRVRVAELDYAKEIADKNAHGTATGETIDVRNAAGKIVYRAYGGVKPWSER
jgi:hypothetical protein